MHEPEKGVNGLYILWSWTYKCQLDGAAETCGCGFIVGGPAVASGPSQGDIRLRLVGGGSHFVAFLGLVDEEVCCLGL